MNKNSNTYIIGYSVIMVVIVALVLAFASLSLQGKQDANVVVEKKGAILMSIGEGMDADKVVDKTAYVNEQYAKYIVDSYAVNVAGDKVEGADAFNLLRNLKGEYDKPAAERALPIFVSRTEEGEDRYILPVWGVGLWGPVWGYIALKSDWDTISGVVFDHKGETPGLGAEITTPQFEDQFIGKTIFNADDMVAISVLKGVGSSAGNNNAVDAISGGTITSRGVESMIKDCLADYTAYIKKQREMLSIPMPIAADTVVVAVDSIAGVAVEPTKSNNVNE